MGGVELKSAGILDHHVDRLAVAGERPVVGTVVDEVLLAVKHLLAGLVGNVGHFVNSN